MELFFPRLIYMCCLIHFKRVSVEQHTVGNLERAKAYLAGVCVCVCVCRAAILREVVGHREDGFLSS